MGDILGKNKIKDSVYVLYVCVYCVYLLCIYKYTHIQYIFWKYLHVYINIHIIDIIYKLIFWQLYLFWKCRVNISHKLICPLAFRLYHLVEENYLITTYAMLTLLSKCWCCSAVLELEAVFYISRFIIFMSCRWSPLLQNVWSKTHFAFVELKSSVWASGDLATWCWIMFFVWFSHVLSCYGTGVWGKVG